MTTASVTIPVGRALLEGDLSFPPGARGLVMFAHGSGSSRSSPRNRFVAETLRERGLGTLLMDLLTREEEALEDLRFDIPLLAERLAGAIAWARGFKATRELAIGTFGASTGAAAALIAAGERPGDVQAVVSRGGRPDLAVDALPAVRAPTLLIVGGEDHEVLALNRRALQKMRAPAELVIVPGATHLFEEPGALADVAALAGAWFGRHLARRSEDEVVPSL